MTLHGADVSNLQGPPQSYREQAWYQSAEFLIIQAISPPKPYPGWDVGGWTADQLRQAKADGKKIGIYVFLWNTLADIATDIQARLDLVPADVALDFRPWVDVEDEAPCSIDQRRKAVDVARATVDAWAAQRGLPPSGGYSRDEYITDYLGGYWPDGWVYWQCSPGANPDELLPMRPIRQTGSDPVDQDSMSDSELVSIPITQPDRETSADWPWPTWREAAINYKAIADVLAQQRSEFQDRLTQIARLATTT